MLMGVKDNGRVMHYFWASPPGSKVRLLWGLDYAVPKGEWYMWDGFTDPAFRNRGWMQKARMSFRSQVSADESIVSAVRSSNAPSIAALKKAGFTVVKTYSGVLILRRLYIIRYGRGLRVGLGVF
jgi:ribosomal protein S18 acetylase RimI-like enzyme